MRAPALLVFLSAAVSAQQGVPHAGYVYPAGGRQGTTVEVRVGGQFLTGADKAYMSGRGVQAKVLEYIRPLTPAQANALRDRVKQINAKQNLTAEDRKTVGEIREQLAKFVRRIANPAIAEIVRLQVNIAPDAAPGDYELRIGTAAGLTNPLVFVIGELPEAQPGDVMLPVTINGRMRAGGVDRIRFRANKGQHLVILAKARQLNPYISDAVPGWFQIALTLRDEHGREITRADHYEFNPDPVLHYEVPDSETYTLEVNDSIYRGRDDFVYRVSIGELPFITSLFPLGGRTGMKTTVEVDGWNLPVSKFVSKGTLGQISFRNAGITSNVVPFALDTLPEVSEKEPNNTSKSAQRVKLPVIVNGRIARAGDIDVFRFSGRAGVEIVAEITARRLESRLDSSLRITDAAGHEIASNDDSDDVAAGLLTHQSDSRVRVKLPSKGTYFVEVRDIQNNTGPYRLRISEPQPDFALRITPSSINVRGGASVALTAHAVRKDAFDGPIALQLRDAPEGFTLDSAEIPAGQDQLHLTLTAPPGRREDPVAISIEGRANLQGRELRRQAIPADDLTQAFAYHHVVPAKDLLVHVFGPGRPALRWKPAASGGIILSPGSNTEIRLTGTVPPAVGAQLRFALNSPPDGISIQDTATAAAGGITIVLHADAKAKVGTKGNLIVDAFVERQAQARPNRVRQPLGTLPAIAYEVRETRTASK